MTERTTRRYSVGLREIGIAIVAALLIGAALFALGRYLGSRELTAARAEMAAERELLAEQIVALDAQMQQAAHRMKLLEARIWLFRAAAELDRRNFGTANEHVRQAASALASVTEPGAGIDVDAVRRMEASVASTDLSVARDLQQQRAQLLELAAQMEAIIPPPALPLRQ